MKGLSLPFFQGWLQGHSTWDEMQRVMGHPNMKAGPHTSLNYLMMLMYLPMVFWFCHWTFNTVWVVKGRDFSPRFLNRTNQMRCYTIFIGGAYMNYTMFGKYNQSGIFIYIFIAWCGHNILLIMSAHWQDHEIHKLLSFSWEEKIWWPSSATEQDMVIYVDITSLGRTVAIFIWSPGTG